MVKIGDIVLLNYIKFPNPDASEQTNYEVIQSLINYGSVLKVDELFVVYKIEKINASNRIYLKYLSTGNFVNYINGKRFITFGYDDLKFASNIQLAKYRISQSNIGNTSAP